MDNSGKMEISLIAFVDAEIDSNGKIADIGALRGKEEFHSRSIKDLILFLRGCKYVCGHNIMKHDLQYIGKELAENGIESFIDTLYFSPLLFPQKPYHRLLKDDKFDPNDRNNPLNDAIKARDLFFDETAQFEKLDERLRIIYYVLLKDSEFFKYFFRYIQYDNKVGKLDELIKQYFHGKICSQSDIKTIMHKNPVELAYAIAQIDVMIIDNASITPPWVLKSFPYVETIMHILKGESCGECAWCMNNLDAAKGLSQWFGYAEFRRFDGENLQEKAAKLAIGGESLLAIFPTGGGKSLTFQLPALMQGENEKGLTVVVSPLQSLQKDQIDNLETKHGITKAVRIDGSLDPIERSLQIERVENGGASLLYLSPESLRNKSIEKLLLKRNVVRFVIDEAHCFSSWGQDFRTDYLYIAQFIKNLQEAKGNNHIIPVSCFTATAKQEVVHDIAAYFNDTLYLELKKVVSTATRKNLRYSAVYVHDDKEKESKLRDLLLGHNCPAIIYVSRTKRATDLAQKLTESGFEALSYHGKMDRNERVRNQDAFTKGECNIIVATKAFGMGVDKDNVGLVVHYNISTSLEDYVQEAGRAGRDEQVHAACYALFNDNDINAHFAFLNQSKITQAEIGQVWAAIKRLTNRREEISVSALEIASEAGWDCEANDNRTRVATSVNALEQVHFLRRGQNMPIVYADGILVKSLMEACAIIEQSVNFEDNQQKEDARRVIARLFKTRAKGGRDADGNNEQIDYIAEREQLDIERVVRAVQKLREEKILADPKDLYSFLKKDGGASAKRVLKNHADTEDFLCGFLEEHQDELRGSGTRFNIKEMCAAQQEAYPNTSIAHLNTILNFYDIKKILKKKKMGNSDYVHLKSDSPYSEIQDKYKKRILLADFILNHVYNKIKDTADDKTDTKVEFSVLELLEQFNLENRLFAETANAAEMEDALYYLKRIGSLEIDGGFLVIYNRMKIQRLEHDNRSRYTREHYEKLDGFYENKREQIHIISEYLKLLSADYNKALEFTYDYFVMRSDMFKHKYFDKRLGELRLNMTVSKYNAIFKDLSPAQLAVINDDKNKYIAVLAGPGSGKTRILTHKLAAIFMQESIRHEQILMLTFTRAAATEFKIRLLSLIGNAANFIKIKTFHSYCFDLLGIIGDIGHSDNIVRETVAKIEEKRVDSAKLTNAILVIDEAQDMGEAEYLLVRALMKANDGLKVIAVGDDDQNIYEWRGSSSEYLGDFSKADGAAKYELIENFRSAKNLVEFSEIFVRKIAKRLKTSALKPVKQQNGKITLCNLSRSAMEIPVVSAVLSDREPGSTCIIVRTNEEAGNVLGLLTKKGISAKIIQTNTHFNLRDLVEVREFTDAVFEGQSAVIPMEAWDDAKIDLQKKYMSSGDLEIVLKLIATFEKLNTRYKYKSDLKQFIVESKLEDFITQDNSIFVSTIHQAKGREFDNVYLALGQYTNMRDEEYRQIYVAITRAKNNLHISYVGDYFDTLRADGLKRSRDAAEYAKPDCILFPLSHRDVYLHFFTTSQKEIEALRSGQDLMADRGGLYANGRRVLRFSKGFVKKIEEKESRGYAISKAAIKHIVYWRPQKADKEQPKEIKIILPEVEFVKK